jgi:hypothetical protein
MSSTGVVAVLDILGYKSFLDNNDVGDLAVEILGVLNNAEDQTTKQILSMLRPKDDIAENKLKAELKEIQWRQFADTILLTRPYQASATNEDKIGCWGSICGVARVLYSHLFAWGLPVRGAVSFGEFLIDKNCFAGRSISDAYQKAQELELSALVVMREKTEEEYLKHGVLERGLWEKHKYDFPLKENKNEKLIALSPIAITSLFHRGGGVRGSIINAFADHNKSIVNSVKNKIDNTEIFFQWCLERERELRGEK